MLSPAELADLKAKFTAELEAVDAPLPTNLVEDEATPTAGNAVAVACPSRDAKVAFGVPVWLAPPPASPPFARRKPLSKASPPSSLARNTSPKPTPTERAERDAVRMKARVAKRWSSPGPGQYSPQKLGSNVLQLAGSTAFRSKSQRPKVDPFLQENGDPGSYALTDIASVMSQATSSFNRSNLTGHGYFGSLSERELRLHSGENSTPGPPDYTPLVPRPVGDTADSTDAAAGAFRSHSLQRKALMPTDTPGVGTYEPNMAAVEPPIRNAGAAMVTGRDSRFPGQTLAGDGRMTGTGVGPGTYQAEVYDSILQASTTAVDRASRAIVNKEAGFGASAEARPSELSWERERQEAPGPGAYDPFTSRELAARARAASSFNASSRAGMEAFGPRSARENRRDGRNLIAVDAGDPGSYDPRSIHTGDAYHVGQLADSTFHRPSAAGLAGFGSQSARVMRQDVMGTDVPGPSEYDPGLTRFGGHRKMGHESTPSRASATLRSTVPQRWQTQATDTPGVGTYEPNVAAVEPPIRNAGAAMVTGRDSYFPGQTLAGDGRMTGTGVGPGTYDPARRNDGEHATIVASVADRAEQGWTWTFVSDHVRTWFCNTFAIEISQALQF